MASLVLAIVAIGYSFISTQNLSETIGTLRTSAENIQRAAQHAAETSQSLSQHAELLSGQVERVPTAVEALSAKLDETVLSRESALANNAVGAESSENLAALNRVKNGSKVGLYLIAKMISHSKSVAVTKILETYGSDLVWAGVLVGHTLAVDTFRPYGVELAHEVIEGVHYYRVTSKGTFNDEEVIKHINSLTDEDIVKVRELIDAYFSRDSNSTDETSS